MTLEAGKAHRLTALVRVQEGSIVSRQVLTSACGSVSVFAFDRGEGLSEHTTPHDALVLVLEGSADVTVAGETTRAQAGDAVILPALVPHALSAPERFVMALVMLRAERRDERDEA